MRKTKIICTLGPACGSVELIVKMIESGMDVARFNFSHSTHAAHREMLDTLRSACKIAGKNVAALMDTKGPEIRLGSFKGGKAFLGENTTFTLTNRQVEGDESICTQSYANLSCDVKVGSVILLDDGLIGFEVVKIDGGDIVCTVKNSGNISDRKGVNVPGVHFSMDYLSEQDKGDIAFAIENDFDFIAASFARSAQDVADIRDILIKANSDIKIIAKIENREGIDNADAILNASDGIMIARGDLGVEIPLEELPAIQKALIRKARRKGKSVITATQMLESMIKNPRPTRAEASDVANAVFDSTGAIMLSGETAIGAHPIEAVQTMARIAVNAEENVNYLHRLEAGRIPEGDVTDAISYATCALASGIDAKAIVALSKTGRTARMISKVRPPQPIICCTYSDKVCRQLGLSWGVRAIKIDFSDSTDLLFNLALEGCKLTGLVEEGDKVIMTAGLPLGISTTNTIKVETVL